MVIADGFVLAGGASRRMGVDKARVLFPGELPMALEVAKKLRSVCERVRLVRGSEEAPWIDDDGRYYEVISDGGGERHPLRGVAAALAQARGPFALFATCDVPFLSVASLRLLVEAADDNGVVATDGARIHPLVGVFPVNRLPEVGRAVERGGSVHAVVEGFARVLVPGEELRNVNTRAL